MSIPPRFAARLSEQESSRYYWLLAACLALVSLPIKNAAYIAPPLYLLIRMFQADNRGARRALFVLSVAAVLSALSIGVDSLRGQEVNVPGLLWGLLTYTPLFLMLGETSDRPVSEACLARIVRTVAWYVIIQSLIGAAQFVLSGNSDAVAGTFGLFDFVFSSITIAQVYYTFVLFGMILFLFVYSQTYLAKAAIMCGLVSCALAQSGHQTIFFVASFGVALLARLDNLRTVIRSVSLMGVLTFVVLLLYPETYTLAVDWYRKVVTSASSPKRMVAEDSLRIMSDGKNLVLGTGMGQFSSRASLIASNEYVSLKLPRLLTGKSDYYRASVAKANRVFEEIGEGSAMSKPYFSLLSVGVELGLLQTTLLAAVWGAHLLRGFRWMRDSNRQVAAVGMAASVGLLFLGACCAVENYLEFPQAVLAPFLLYVVALSLAKADVSQRVQETAGPALEMAAVWGFGGFDSAQLSREKAV